MNNPNTNSIEKVRVGQRWILFAILLNISLFITPFIPPNDTLAIIFGLLSIFAMIPAIVLAVLGVIKLSSGLGYGLPVRILIVISLFIPLISLIVLIILTTKATSVLRAAGYKVGLLGAAKQRNA